MDVGGRATHGAVAEKVRMRALNQTTTYQLLIPSPQPFSEGGAVLGNDFIF